jgi:membrane-bound metal-dependent hydrolase YbcI (DUF457 family)
MIGGIGYLAITGVSQEPSMIAAGSAFIAGSILPDLDVFLMIFGKRFYLKNHQGLTHSLLLSPLFALLITIPLTYAFGLKFSLFIVFAALSGLCLHALLDIINTFGISLFWPLSGRRYSYDSVFFIDAPAWAITILLYLSLLYFRTTWSLYIYIAVFTLYIVFKLIMHRRVMGGLKCSYAIPGSLNPFEYYILEKKDQAIYTYRYSSASKRRWDPSERHLRMAQSSRLFNDLASVAKSFHITGIQEDHEGTTIIAKDLAVRNFGGKFGRTTLKFNREGELVHETAYI